MFGLKKSGNRRFHWYQCRGYVCGMKTWFGTYFTSSHAEPLEATVLAYEKVIAIGFCLPNGINSRVAWDIGDIEVVFDSSLQSTKMINVNERGTRLMIEGKAAKDFIEELQTEQNKPWHKKDKTKEIGRNLSIFLGIASILVTAYFLMVPWLSEKLASGVSLKTEEQIGNAVFDALSLSAQEDKNATIILNDFFKKMKVVTGYNVRITVVNGEAINAFALPGGNIVVYSALLKELKTYPELAALLSHEFAHIENKHSTKSIFRQLGSRVFLSMLFGRFGSVTSVIIEQADKFKSLKYSRKLEKQADMEGLAILKNRKIDPEGFVFLFKRLKESASASALPELLASHPDIDKRVAYIREASQQTDIEEHTALNTIFQKLK
jgi:Zn-dependent protease with chaperone function